MFKKLILCSAVFVLVGSLISGCSSIIGHQIDQSAYSKIVIGTSTKDDVTELMGSPYSEAVNDDGTSSFTYMYIKTETGLYGIGGVKQQSQQAVIKFNKKGVVTGKSKNKSQY